MRDSIRLLFVLSVLMLVMAASAPTQAAPVATEITGEIERLTLNDPANIYSGGVMIVAGTQVILPRNLLIDLPANRLSLQQIFAQAPAGCIANGESGLAKADKCISGGTGGFVTLSGVHSNAGNVIAGDVLIEKGTDIASGVISYINYTDGYFRLNGILNDPATGTMVRLNDPAGRHTIQQGAGCAGGPNCSADPRFALDADNYVSTFSTGYPLCIPSTVSRNFPGLPAIPASGIPAVASGPTFSDGSGSGDRACPSTNRTAGLIEPPVNDSRLFAPLMVGDSVNAKGNYETINGVRFLSSHTTKVLKALQTKNLAGQPDYLFLQEVFLEAPGFQNQRARMLIIGFTTLAPTDVDFWTLHRDPVSNATHEFPLASVKGCDVAAGLGTCSSQGLVGAGGNIFRIRYDVDFLLAAAGTPGGASAKLSPCLQLGGSARFAASNPGICSTGHTLANNFAVMSPIPHEIQSRTGHLLDAPAGSLVTLDINGNPATNGQYLFPFGINLGGVETADFLEIDINLLNTPRAFEGIPWNLDRRLSPSGCLNAGGCESLNGNPLGSFALDPFPYTGLDPRTQANFNVLGVVGGTPKTSFIPGAGLVYSNSTLSTPGFGASNRVFSYVSGTPFAGGRYNFDGNNTLLPYVPGSFPADPPLITINPTPVLNIFPPIADEDAATTVVGSAVTINILANDIAVLGSIDPTSVKIVSNPTNGAAGVNLPAGTITYTPGANFSGTDTLTYTVANNYGSISAPGTVTVTVARKPTANNDTASVQGNGTVSINVTANDVAGTSLINLASVNITSGPSCGTLTNQVDGIVVFTAPATAGTCTFNYVIGDVSVPPLISNVATANVTVTAIPVIITTADPLPNATVRTLYNQTIAYNGGVGPYTWAAPIGTLPTGINFFPGSGTLFGNPTTPGAYSFTLQLTDSLGTTAIKPFNLTVVAPPNPIAVDDTATVVAGATVVINVLTNDTATAPKSLNPATLSVSAPTGGTATPNLNGTVSYTAPLTPGNYSFNYSVKDTAASPLTSNVAVVVVTVTLPPPVAPALISPNSTVATATPVFTWNAVANAAIYTLWNANSGFTTYTAAAAGCPLGTGTCSATLATPLPADTAVNWAVKTTNFAGASPWSTVFSVTFSTAVVPVAPTLVGPNGTVLTATPTYTWNAVADATSYTLWNANSGFTTYTATTAGCPLGTGTCSATLVTPLPAGTTFAWAVKSINTAGSSPWSAVMSVLF